MQNWTINTISADTLIRSSWTKKHSNHTNGFYTFLYWMLSIYRHKFRSLKNFILMFQWCVPMCVTKVHYSDTNQKEISQQQKYNRYVFIGKIRQYFVCPPKWICKQIETSMPTGLKYIHFFRKYLQRAFHFELYIFKITTEIFNSSAGIKDKKAPVKFQTKKKKKKLKCITFFPSFKRKIKTAVTNYDNCNEGTNKIETSSHSRYRTNFMLYSTYFFFLFS